MSKWDNCRRIFSAHPSGFDELIYQDGQIIVRRAQWKSVIKRLLQHNQDCRNSGANGFSDSRDFQRVASIPFVEYYEITKQHGDGWVQNPRILSKVLRDRPWLKTCHGNV